MTLPWDVLAVGLIRVCWGAFCLAWAIGWLYNLGNAPALQRRSGGLSTWLVVIALFALARIVIPHQVWDRLTLHLALLRAVGAVVLVVATLFTLWSRVSLGTMWTLDPVIKEQHELRTTGPYACTRHPIYTGMLGMLMGTALLSSLGIWLYYVLVGIIVAKIKIRFEERMLEATFGDRYREYRRQVGELVPKLR